MIFIDTNIFMYAVGSEHINKSKCTNFLNDIVLGGNAAGYCTNVEVLQEILHRYKSINRFDVGSEIFELILNLGIIIYPIEIPDLKYAKRILNSYKKLDTRDAVHIGMCLRREVEIIVTLDKKMYEFKDMEIRGL